MTEHTIRSMLVTGGAGFIGANFVRYVLTQDPSIKIINLDKLTYAGSLDNLKELPHPSQHHFIHGDITDTQLVTHLLQHHHIDTIVHFAAESHVDRSITTPGDFIQSNIVGTFTLLEAAKKYGNCRFHHISTDEVYGSLEPHDPTFTETTPYQPRSPYSASKASSDHLVRAYYHTYGLPITLSHCSNNYGPYQHTEKLIPTIIQACLHNKRIPIYGQGKNIRDWLYVKDHCEAILCILKRGRIGESYNIGGDNEWENIALARYICQRMDAIHPGQKPYESLIEFTIDRLGHDFRYAINANKMKNELGWEPRESLETGLEKTIRFTIQKMMSEEIEAISVC